MLRLNWLFGRCLILEGHHTQATWYEWTVLWHATLLNTHPQLLFLKYLKMLHSVFSLKYGIKLSMNLNLLCEGYNLKSKNVMKYPDQKLEPIFFHGFKTTICYTNVNIFLIMMFHEKLKHTSRLKNLTWILHWSI